MDCQETSDPITPVSVAQVFPLPCLPLEIQLLVLRECLISNTPLLDYGAKPGRVHLTMINEPRGQDDICFGILSTCKLYHKEGLKFLYAYNHFSYTEIFETERQWWSQLPAIPEEPRSNHLSYPMQQFSNLKHLILRTMGMTKHLGSWITIMSCKDVLALCPCLQTLQLDIVSLPRDSPKFEKRELKLMNHLISNKNLWSLRAQRRRQEPRDLCAVNGGLRQLVITGLGADFCGLLAVKHALCLLADGGKLAIGMGWKGRRFKGKVHERYVIPESSPELFLTWLDFQDIGRWIEANREEYDPHGICGKLENASNGT